MSLGVVIKGPEGVVLAADSRVTLEARRPDGRTFLVTFDNATKLLSLNKPHNSVGAVTYGAAVIGQRTAHSFVPEFELTLEAEEKNLSVEEYARRLSAFFMEQWQRTMPGDYRGPAMSFIVGGYDPDEAYGSVFLFSIPSQPDPEPRNAGEGIFGMTWGGQLEVVSRLIHGYDPAFLEVARQALNLDADQIGALREALTGHTELRIPYQVLAIQDCVDLATFLVRTTMMAQSLAIGVRGVGGPIDVATVTRTAGLEYVQRKDIRGEIRQREV